MNPGLTVCDEAYRDILRTARRYSRSAEEARDLVQDAIAIALARGFEDWPSPSRRAWLRGVVRKRAAFLLRGQARRRRRERGVELPEAGGAEVAPWTWEPSFLSALAPSLRALALLVSADLCVAEIRWLLGLNDTAFRQRLSALRRALRAQADPPTRPLSEPALPFGPQRAHVLAVLRRQRDPALATHDPDGHAILLRINAHKAPVPGNRWHRSSFHVQG
jgi:RNA polymerase sigma-70 factor (ECF subfamily)